MVPAQSRLPYPWVALCLCVQNTIAAGLVTETLACIITFTFYLRPSEGWRLQGKLITAPAPAPRRVQNGQDQMWSTLLRPHEGSDTSKTGRVDESSLARYGRGKRINEQLSLLPQGILHVADRAASNIGVTLASASRSL